MALGLKKENNTVFLTVKHHCLCEESKSPRDGFQAIEVTNPKTKETVVKHIRAYEFVEGLITKIEWYDTKDSYSTRYLGYKIHIDADGQPVVLDLPFKTRPYDAFTKFAENIDFTQPVRFSAWHDRKNDATAFCARHGENVIRYKYTRENPGKMPPAEHDEVTGWDFKRQRVWLKERIDKVVIPACQKAAEMRQRPVENIDPQEPFGYHDDELTSDDIPF